LNAGGVRRCDRLNQAFACSSCEALKAGHGNEHSGARLGTTRPLSPYLCGPPSVTHTAMHKLRIVTLGISGGRWLTRPLHDARRFASTRWYPVPGATRTPRKLGICPSFKDPFLSPRAEPYSSASQLMHRCIHPCRSLIRSDVEANNPQIVCGASTSPVGHTRQAAGGRTHLYAWPSPREAKCQGWLGVSCPLAQQGTPTRGVPPSCCKDAPDPRQQQDWILKCLQGGRAQADPLARGRGKPSQRLHSLNDAYSSVKPSLDSTH
jgi:hypothetical protein